jgi:hypothetical protein
VYGRSGYGLASVATSDQFPYALILEGKKKGSEDDPRQIDHINNYMLKCCGFSNSALVLIQSLTHGTYLHSNELADRQLSSKEFRD